MTREVTMGRSTLSQERATLTRAWRNLRRDGWRQGPDHAPGEPCCLVWALTHARRDLGYAGDDAVTRLRSLVNAPSLVDWNDTRGRTWQDVEDLLRRAIAEIDEEAATTDVE